MLHKKLFLSLLALLFLQITVAQKVIAIDQKGTKVTVINNKVTDSVKPHANPNSNDVWFDSSVNPPTVKIFNGTAWVSLEHKGTKGSIFFAGADGVITENNSQLLWDYTAKILRVGAAGDTGTKLTVNGSISSKGISNTGGITNSGPIYNDSGAVGTPSYSFTGDTNTGIYRPAEDQLAFSTNGTQSLFIDAAQQVNFLKNVRLEGKLLDGSGLSGTAGQVLSSTGTAEKTAWIDPKLVNVLPLIADYLLTSADSGKVITMTSAEATVITVPSTLPVGYNVSIYQLGAGTVTITGSGVTVLNRLSRFKTAGKDAGVGLLITATNTAHLTGDLKK